MKKLWILGIALTLAQPAGATASLNACPDFRDIVSAGLKQLMFLTLTGNVEALKSFRYTDQAGKSGKLANLQLTRKNLYRDTYKKYGAMTLVKTLAPELLQLNLPNAIPGKKMGEKKCHYHIQLDPLVAKNSERHQLILAAIPEAKNLFPLTKESISVDLIRE